MRARERRALDVAGLVVSGHEGSQRPRALESHYALLRALLDDALRGARGGRADDLLWLFGEPDEPRCWRFTAQQVCDFLGVDIVRVRRLALRQMVGGRSGGRRQSGRQAGRNCDRDAA